jgi:hypothetical protein
MLRPLSLTSLLLAASLAAACGDDTPTTPTDTTPPVAITEEFSETLNPNGGRTHEFPVDRAGTVTARLTALAPDDTVTVGLSLGTWNGSSCKIEIAKDDATLTAGTVIGTATGTGLLCVRIYDVGDLTASTDYTVTVEHF